MVIHLNRRYATINAQRKCYTLNCKPLINAHLIIAYLITAHIIDSGGGGGGGGGRAFLVSLAVFIRGEVKIVVEGFLKLFPLVPYVGNLNPTLFCAIGEATTNFFQF